jgi:hypothetical protein
MFLSDKYFRSTSMQPLTKPAGYRPEFAEKARKWALMRATDEDLAWLFGIPLTTLHEWLASVPEFAAAVRHGRDLGDAEVIDSFHQLATGCFPEVVVRSVGPDGAHMTYTRYRPPHRGARNFWQLNRLPGEQCRKVEIEAGRTEGEPRHLTRSELERKIAELTAARGPAADG